ANGYSVHGSYTLSRTRTNVDSLANLSDLPEGLDIEVEEAPLRQEVRNRFTLSMLSEIPPDVSVVGGIKLSSVVSLESGRHYNVFVGSDADQDGNPNTNRPVWCGGV